MTAIRTYLPRLLDGLWFHQLPEALREALLDAAVLRRLESGQRLFSRGDKPCGLYAVLEGAIRIGAVGTTGKEALLTLIEPPSWFGEISLFDGQPRTHDAYAEGATLLLNVPQPALLALLEREPRYWRDLALLMSQKLRLAFVALEEMSLLPASLRLARRLVMIAEGYGWASGARRVIHLSQEQLALMLAISRQTTNQILKDLEAQGILRLTYGGIEILDPERLRHAAQGRP
ncbi:Crp/Fnr family transcriptional regulator [Zestomonas thermotolerans]|uniref:Crp/Fnr family transcriptional regulator n=1 Tax=Zestomonas thermotolerans TaxID=157784 RepID=UPI0004856432|nr:Crp/Fnr family transcriptional regulator [Pseudomonas thermotolerans]MBO2510258.1 Crp/Fnr family transcriptional regulator [Gammaproteobacteria bacterium]